MYRQYSKWLIDDVSLCSMFAGVTDVMVISSPVSSLISFFGFRIPSRPRSAFSCQVSTVSSGLQQFLRLSLFHDLENFMEYLSVLLNLGLSAVFISRLE